MISAGRQPFVLVADDDQDTRELYRACFDTSGYRTAEARTGSQAIVSAMEIVPDVLLTDYVLPDIDGVTIARRLKADPRTAAVHILLVTGYATPDLEQAALAAGVERVLLKPCLPQVVMREVGRAMSRPLYRKPQRPSPVPKADGGALAREERRDRRNGVRRTAVAARVREEFAALPGLALTAEQARLLFNVDRDAVERILLGLVAEGFLSQTPHGAFRRERR
jgi:two-component system, cell cycle response regulator DivK